MGKSIRELAEESRKPIIAHHSTWLGIDPHDINSDTSIHAGTQQSAVDRLGEALSATVHNSGLEPGERLVSYLHSYEIPKGLIDRNQHNDPIFNRNSRLRHSNTSRKRLKNAPEYVDSMDYKRSDKGVEGTPKEGLKVIKYKNEIEDPGSTSYVIPSPLINSGRVKYLGQQFLTYAEIEDGNNAIYDEPDFSNIKERP